MVLKWAKTLSLNLQVPYEWKRSFVSSCPTQTSKFSIFLVIHERVLTEIRGGKHMSSSLDDVTMCQVASVRIPSQMAGGTFDKSFHTAFRTSLDRQVNRV